MPELPEVETLRQELILAINGKTIKSATVKVSKMVKPLTSAEFSSQIKNKKVLGINRRAKVLIIELSSSHRARNLSSPRINSAATRYLLIHLKLTGQLIYQAGKLASKQAGKLVVGGHPQKGGTENLPNKFTHIIFEFTDGSKLYFNDLRKFGWMKLVSKEQVSKLVSEFGVEPLGEEFTLKKFQEILNKYPNRKIKQVLMDQSLIAGIGNIYADESCFCAKILPTRVIKTLKEEEIKALFKCIPRILELAISKKGTSANTYVQLDGSPGGFIPYLSVYGRQEKKCKRCGGIVNKIKLNGRGTHFCNKCQK